MTAGYFGRRKRRAAWGSLPNRKPNRHRIYAGLIEGLQPLRYPQEVHDADIPYSTRKELKDRIFKLWLKSQEARDV